MEPNGCGQASSPERGLEVASDVATNQRRANASAEHEAVVGPVAGSQAFFSLVRLVSTQHRNSNGRERDGAAARLRLGRTELWGMVLNADEITADGQRAAIEVHV